MNTKLYIDFIKSTLKTHGLEVADRCNKQALADKKITLKQYIDAAQILAQEIINR